MALPVSHPIDPMLAKLARTIPRGDGLLYEPKWDGFRCIVFVDGGEVVLQSRNKKPLNRYFPELIATLAAALPDRCVVDGEIVVPDADGNGLDFDALGQRIHPAASRVEMLAAATPAHFVAFDALAIGDEDLMEQPISVRRARLVEILTTGPSIHLTPATEDPDVAEEWFVQFEGAGLDGVMAKPLNGHYEPGKRSLIKVKHERVADCVVAGYRIHKDGEGVGSLLLGLFDDADELRHVGVCATFSAAFRVELLELLKPYTSDAVIGHPWQQWIEAQDALGPGRTVGGSRWNAGKDTSFVPVRPELVVEVTFGQLESGRFRHGVKFQRWRPDRDPESCRFDQLEVAEPIDFAALFSGDWSPRPS